MEAAGSSKTVIIIYQTTKHHIFFYPEEGTCGFLRNASHILHRICELLLLHPKREYART
jgi:hypothetical protein